MSATPEELEIIRHSLGMVGGKRPYRNHFAASDGHRDLPAIFRAVAKGLMMAGYTTKDGMTFYHVTDAGCALVGTTREEAER